MQDGQLQMTLAGDLDIYVAAEARVALLEALAQEADMTLDLSTVESVDAAGVQVLLAARRSAEEQGLSLRWVNPSRAITDVIQLMGMSDP